jgi:hypothetical protein
MVVLPTTMLSAEGRSERGAQVLLLLVLSTTTTNSAQAAATAVGRVVLPDLLLPLPIACRGSPLPAAAVAATVPALVLVLVLVLELVLVPHHSLTCSQPRTQR